VQRIRASSRFALWVGLVCFCVFGVGVAVMISRAHWYDATTLQQQVLSIAGQLHAPGDENTMTAATSSLTSAQHIRYQIQTLLLQGKTSSQIIQWMVQTYGPDVLAAPRLSGFGNVAWIAPWAVLLVFASVAVLFVRRATKAKLTLDVSEKTSVVHPVVSDEMTNEIDSVLKDYL